MEDSIALALLRQIRDGDKAAFDQLYQEHAPMLYTYLLRLLTDEQAAQDVLQIVFLAVWQQAGKFRGEASVRTWLLRIASYQAISWHRHNHQQQNLSEVEWIEELNWQEIRSNFERIEEYQGLQQALFHLSAEQRALLELTFVHELPPQQIASILSCPVGTVKSRLHRTLRLLAGLLQRTNS